MSRDVAAYCLVTVVHDRRRIDAALPTAVPVAELLPALLRVVVPDSGSDETVVWELAPIGRPVLDPAETLDEAAVLTGELLMLQRQENPPRTGPKDASVRDQLEEVVQRLDEPWTTRCWTAFLLWWAAILGVVLLVPASQLSGPSAVAITAVVAGGLAASAVLAARVDERVTAATCLWIGCGWAALAGWLLSPGGAGPVGAALAALLLAAATVRGFHGALTHCAALAVPLPVAAVLLTAGPNELAGYALVTVAILSLLVLGLAPRVVLALTGLSSSRRTADAAAVEARFARADLVLTGVLIGLTGVVVAGAAALAFSPEPLDHGVAAVIGMSLLLRSRVYSRVPHLLPTRIGGALLLGAVGAGLYLREPGLRPMLILLSMVGLTVLIAILVLFEGQMTAVGRARFARCLDVLDHLVVVAVIIGGAGILGLFSWLATLLD